MSWHSREKPQLHLKTMSEPTTADNTQKAVANDALFVVAQIAAMCCTDLDSNLASAHKEYMAGEIPNGAFQHVLHRHTQMHAALHAAGYTEKHPIFGWPAMPKSLTNA